MINGEIMKVHFKEGQEVQAGDLLFTIDPRPFEAALLQAQATLAQHQAAVTQAEANLARDRRSSRTPGWRSSATASWWRAACRARAVRPDPHATSSTLAATVDADRAAVETAKALVRADEAAVENARVQLSYTEIRAPIDGRTGNLLVRTRATWSRPTTSATRWS